jgi:hypothetical protein
MTYPDTITLARGAHKDRSNGLCLLEAVAWFAGESHSDHPACVSPVLAAYGRHLNDVLPDESRRLLIPFIPAMSRTADDGLDEARGYLALDWLIRVYTPAWLDLAGLSAEAGQLRGLHRINDLITAWNAGSVVRMAADKANAAGDAAGDAAWAAAADAAGIAAWDAAGAAAGDAAWHAAGDAAGDAAWAAAWAAAAAAAGGAAGDAAGDAVRNKLALTVTQLQDSAILLLSTMIHPEMTA